MGQRSKRIRAGIVAGVCLAAAAWAQPAIAATDEAPTPEPVAAPEVLSTDGLGEQPLPYAEEAPPADASAEEVDTRGAPANPTPVELTQPDGATFAARQWGDGVLGGWERLDGHTIGQAADGTWVYVDGVDRAGAVVLGDVRADGPAPADVAPRVRGEDPGPLPTPGAEEPSAAPHVPHSGTARTLVILAAFSNQAGSTTAAAWNSSFFGSGNTVAGFYDTASYGALDVLPAADSHGTANDGVVGWVTLGRSHPNTGRVDSTTDYANVNGTVRDAVLAADPFVNFATYDTNGNNSIEPRELHVVVITAGFEASYSSACGNTVWGHQWASYYVTPAVVDGRSVASSSGGSYTMFGERHCANVTSDNHQATIGIMVHEIGHDLGWPDLYDITGATQGGVGTWSVMAGGSWATVSGQFPGARPTLPDAFSRSYQGWATPSQVSGSGQARTVSAASGSSSASTIYRVLANPGGVDWAFQNSGSQTGTGEYFLIENRQQTGWDAGLPGCGILIWHIDETRSASQPNATASRRLVQLEQADGLGHIDGSSNRGDAGDPYPGSSNKTVFDLASTPGSRLYSGADSGVTVQVPSGSCTSSKSITISTAGGPVTPSNDSFSSPVALTAASGFLTGSTVGATTQTGEPDHAGRTGDASIWYRWTAASTGRLLVHTGGSSFDTVLGVYAGGSVSTLTTLASNDDSSLGGVQSRIDGLPVVRGSTYQIAVDGYDSDVEGAVSFSWDLTPTPGPAPLASWTAFINRQFQDLMGRAPTSSELSTWQSRLADPAQRGTLIASLRASSRHTGIVDPVTRLYRAYFLRHPDRSGLLYWIGERARGVTLSRVSQQFANSPEFRELYGTLANRAFVAQIYLNVLGRPATTADLDWWTAELDSGRRTRGAVMIGFSESEEYRTGTKAEVDTAVITLLMLRRQPTAAEVGFWRYERTQSRLDNARLGEWALAHTTYPAS